MLRAATLSLALFAPLFALSCGSGSDALGVAAECASDEECQAQGVDTLSCLTQFRGGYCGLAGCAANADCPEDAICVTHTDQQNYCFKVCGDKSECNTHRSVDNEANCSANIVRVEAGSARACIPPSSGTL